MKREFSLKGRNIFKEVYLKGKRYQKQGIQIIVLREQVLEPVEERKTEKQSLCGRVVKMGISVNRRFGKAHDRNKLKRQIRAIWSDNLKNMQPGFYVIVRPGEASKPLNYSQKRDILQELLRRAGVLGI